LQIASPDSCNIYYVENGICRTGILDNARNLSKPIDSSPGINVIRLFKSVIYEFW
jgi:hypothetical protein